MGPYSTTDCGGCMKATGPRILVTGSWWPPAVMRLGAVDLSRDRSESQNLAADHPEKVRELQQWWTQCTPSSANLPARIRRSTRPPARRPRRRHCGCQDSPSASRSGPHSPCCRPSRSDNSRSRGSCTPTLPGYPDEHETWMHQQFLAAGITAHLSGLRIAQLPGNRPGCPRLQPDSAATPATTRSTEPHRGNLRTCPGTHPCVPDTW